MTKFWKSFLLITLFSQIFFLSCSTEPKSAIRIGTNIWPGYEPLYLAQELGYYDQYNIKLIEYFSSSDVINAFRNGTLDAAALTLDEVLMLNETLPDISIICILDFSNGADIVVGKPYINNLNKLKGKRVGVESTALGAFMLARALEKAQLTPDEIEIKPFVISEHEKAFKENLVDAIVTFEPVKTKLIASGAVSLFDSSQIPGEIIDVLVVRNSVIETNYKQLLQLVNGWSKALTYINNNNYHSAAIMARREQLTTEEFINSLKGLHLVDIKENKKMLTENLSSIEKTAKKLIEIMRASHLIEKQIEIDSLFNSRIISESE